MKFLLVQTTAPDHLYAVVNRAIASSLARLGHEAQILPAPAGAPLDQVVGAIHAAAPDHVFSLGSFLGGIAADNGASIFDILGYGFIGWQFDHPLYTEHNLVTPMAGRCSVYPNASHAEFAARLGVCGGSAVLLAGGSPLEEPIRAYRDRSIPILVVATYNGRPDQPWGALPDGAGKALVAAVCARLMADPEVSLAAACDAVRADFGLGPGLERDLAEPLRRVLTFVRHKDRLDAITALVESGLPVTLVGDGWAGHFGDRPNLTARPSVPFAEASRLYNDARLVLNLNAANGGCERTIQAMLAGAAVVSDRTASYAAMGMESGDLRIFDRLRPDTLPHGVGELLEGDAEQVAEAGHRRAVTSQLWDHRLAALLATIRR
jgi:hypothetical protein